MSQKMAKQCRAVQHHWKFPSTSQNLLGSVSFESGMTSDGAKCTEDRWTCNELFFDQEAVINFKTGRASFPKISSQQVQLERSSTFHLMLPLNAFGGQTEIVEGLFVKPESQQAFHHRGQVGIGTAPPE